LGEDADLKKVAHSEECENFTGADLASLVREASIAAFREFVLPAPGTTDSKKVDPSELKVYQRHFEIAFKKTKASVAPKVIYFSNFMTKYKNCTKLLHKKSGK